MGPTEGWLGAPASAVGKKKKKNRAGDMEGASGDVEEDRSTEIERGDSGIYEGEEGDEGDEGDVEDTPPLLKYARLAGDLPTILEEDSISCFHIADRMLILGTNKGWIHLFDLEGNEIFQVCVHSGTVLCLLLYPTRADFQPIVFNSSLLVEHRRVQHSHTALLATKLDQ